MTRASRYRLQYVCTAFLALFSYALDVASPAVVFAVNGQARGCQCGTENGNSSCQCGGSCCGTTAEKSSVTAPSCCATQPSRETTSSQTSKPSCCSTKIVTKEIVKEEKTTSKSTCCKTPKEETGHRVRGRCTCGDRPDTATGDAPPRVIPDPFDGEPLALANSHEIGLSPLYQSIGFDLDPPPPRSV